MTTSLDLATILITGAWPSREVNSGREFWTAATRSEHSAISGPMQRAFPGMLGYSPQLARNIWRQVSEAEIHLMISERSCPFCTPPSARVIAERDTALLIRDGFPVSVGHMLAIPRRHVGSWFDTSEEERRDLIGLLDLARDMLGAERPPDGWTIGINDGPAAGQTVPHLHVHLIPRYVGDVADPRGGVRWVIPKNAKYWSE